uniref:Thrombospondin type 1 domain-containing protein n=1 Tax=Wuchereria bancrofti TaxID=6293 RepID=A0A1I8F0M3_WUCBA
MNERGGIFQEDYYPEHNKNKQPINPENDNTKEDEFDGIDYGKEQGSASEITDKQYSHQNFPYDSRTETFSSTLVPHVHFNQQSNLVQSVHERHNLTDPPLQEHLGVLSENFYRQQQFPEFLPEDFNHEQQIYSQPSGFKLDKYYRQQQQESTTSPEEYHREQQARPEPSGSEVDEYYRSQQQYNGKGQQDSLEAKHYPNSSRDLVHEQQLSSYVQVYRLSLNFEQFTSLTFLSSAIKCFANLMEFMTTWSIYPVTCGDSVQIRRRTCSSPTGINCLGDITQQRPCHFRPCDMWTDWNDNCGSCANH